MPKILNKITLMINSLVMLPILYNVFVLFKESGGSGDIFGKDFLTSIYIVIFVYIVAFIHIFFYESIKDKIKIMLVDLLPLIFFVVSATLVDETKLRIILHDILLSVLLFYFIGGSILLGLNWVTHKIYNKLKDKEKK